MRLKIDARFKKKNLIVVSNMAQGIFRNFHPTTQKFKNFTSMGHFGPNYTRFKLKNHRDWFFMTLNSDSKFE